MIENKNFLSLLEKQRIRKSKISSADYKCSDHRVIQLPESMSISGIW